MRRRFVRSWLALVVLVIAAPGATSSVLAAPGPSASTLRTAGAAAVHDVFIRMPQTAAPAPPLQVIVALHGMGGNGADFGGALAEQADRYGWLIVAPTFAYGDWTDPNQIVHEDPALVAWLSDYLKTLPERTGLDAIQPRVLLFGHSRGAQLALRFAEIHPEQVAAVAAVSAGTYTLPLASDAQSGQTLNFPFGVADLAHDDGGRPFDAARFDSIPVWIGVGGADNNPADVPAAWTRYIGPDRLDRAKAFASALQSLGANVSLAVFPGTDHTLTNDMRASGCAALASAIASTDTQS
jgi:pimeloyl-ACP methyl ester carboxylesterase